MTTPYKSLHEQPPLDAVDPTTQARARGVAPLRARPSHLAAPAAQARAPFSFAALKGRPVLVVNVASACGLTAQNYAELVEARPHATPPPRDCSAS